MAVMIKNLPLLMLAGLIACGPAEDEPGPGGVSADDARSLDEAAAKLNDPNGEAEE